MGIFWFSANFAGLCKICTNHIDVILSLKGHIKNYGGPDCPLDLEFDTCALLCFFCCFCFNECEQWIYRKSCLPQLMPSPPTQCNPGPLWRHSQLYLNLITILLGLQMNYNFKNTLSWLDMLYHLSKALCRMCWWSLMALLGKVQNNFLFVIHVFQWVVIVFDLW